VDHDAREVTAVSRGQNVVYVMPHDWASIAQFLGPMLDRVDDHNSDVQLLLVSSDVELAAALAASAVKLTEGRSVGIIAATSARRAARLIRLRPPQVVAATPESVGELLKAAALKLDTVRMVAIAWLDELIAQGATTALETVMTEVPPRSRQPWKNCSSDTLAGPDASSSRRAWPTSRYRSNSSRRRPNRDSAHCVARSTRSTPRQRSSSSAIETATFASAISCGRWGMGATTHRSAPASQRHRELSSSFCSTFQRRAKSSAKPRAPRNASSRSSSRAS